MSILLKRNRGRSVKPFASIACEMHNLRYDYLTRNGMKIDHNLAG